MKLLCVLGCVDRGMDWRLQLVRDPVLGRIIGTRLAQPLQVKLLKGASGAVQFLIQNSRKTAALEHE
jgi:hypothetical protein